MDGKRFFFFSMIILSIAMGAHWLKYRPKTPKRIKPPNVLVPINPDEIDPIESPASASLPVNVPIEDYPENASKSIDIHAPVPLASNTDNPSVVSEENIKDPILKQWATNFRDPFTPSPFAKLLAQAGKQENSVEQPVIVEKRKPTQLLTAAFTGTLESETGLTAVIGSDLFKSGQVFQGKTIKKIEKPIITLEDANAIYVLPKKGVVVQIATDGTFSFEDNFVKIR